MHVYAVHSHHAVISRCPLSRSYHRRTSQGGWGLQPPDWGKAIIFRAKAKFFGQKPAAKSERKIFLFRLAK